MGVSRALISCHITMSTMRLSPKNSVNAKTEMPQNPVKPKAYLPAVETHAPLSKPETQPLESVQMQTCILCRSQMCDKPQVGALKMQQDAVLRVTSSPRAG